VTLARFRKTKVTGFLSYMEDRCNTNKHIVIYTYKYIECVSKSGVVRGD
jgi:hypothetical protein